MTEAQGTELIIVVYIILLWMMADSIWKIFKGRY